MGVAPFPEKLNGPNEMKIIRKTESANEIVIPSFETKRLLIRHLTREDVDFLFEHFSQKAINRFTYVNFGNLEDAYDFYERWCVSGDSTRFRLGIVLKTTQKLIGTLCYENWSKRDRRAEIGYDLSKFYWGQGLMTEALRPIIQFGFEGMQLNRIEVTTNSKNDRSIRLLKRLGFVQEGVLRQKYYFRGQFHDEIAFSLLSEEWKQYKKS